MTIKADLSNIWPEKNRGRKGASVNTDDSDPVRMCRYCGMKTRRYCELDGKQIPFCNLVCAGLFDELVGENQ